MLTTVVVNGFSWNCVAFKMGLDIQHGLTTSMESIQKLDVYGVQIPTKIPPVPHVELQTWLVGCRSRPAAQYFDFLIPETKAARPGLPLSPVYVPLLGNLKSWRAKQFSLLLSLTAPPGLFSRSKKLALSNCASPGPRCLAARPPGRQPEHWAARQS